MKAVLLIILFALFSCSADEVKQEPQQECYKILSRGYDSRGNYIIVKFQDFVNKRYQVENYQDYISQNEICDLSNLTEQPL